MSDNVNDSQSDSRIEKMEMLKDNNPKLDTPENIVRKAVERKYPRLTYEESRKVVNDLVTKPSDGKIKIGDEEIRIDGLSEYVADSIEAINSGSSEYGASSMGEYFGWIETGKKIIKNMTDGEITKNDLDSKHHFLQDFQQREVDLMTCIALYRNCNLDDPLIKSKYDELNRKLIKLREIRSSVENSTTDKVDEKTLPENELAKRAALGMVYIAVLDKLYIEAKTKSSQISDEQKRSLNIYNNGYVNSEYILSSIRRANFHNENYKESLAEIFVIQKQELKPQSRESIEHKLAILSGRRSPVRTEPEYEYEQTRARSFDMNKYMMLKKQREEQAYAYA